MYQKQTDKLTQECAQAKAAGLSYGQWKALQPRVEVVVDPAEIPEGYLKCKYCGKLFEQYRNKRYCNDDCRLQAYNKSRREEK